MSGGTSTATGIDRILDSGIQGLGFFTAFVPRYRSWTGVNPQGQDEDSLTARYEQQAGMDVEPLRAFTAVLASELEGALGSQVGIQQARYRELPARWSGSPAADSAAGFVGTLTRQVGAEHDTLSDIARAVSIAADALEQVVRTKADAVRTDLSAVTVAGKTADQVDRIIAHARGSFAGAVDTGARAQLVQRVLPEMSSTTDPVSYCQRWLDQVFAPAVEGKVAAFTTLADATHTAVQGVYEHLSNALESASLIPYTSPGGQKSATTALAAAGPGAAPAAYATASYITPVGSPASTTPASTTAADTSTPAGQDTFAVPASTQQSPSSATAPAASFIAADTTGNGSGGGAGNGSGSGSGAAGSATSNTQPTTPAPSPGTVADMGTPGVWRPGDIANVLTAASGDIQGISTGIQGIGTVIQGIGSVVQGTGDLVKDVIGQNGVTGLIQEGVDAAGKIDVMVEHHFDPASAHDPADSTTAPTASSDTGTGGGGAGGAPVQQTADTHATDTSSATDTSRNTQAAQAPAHAAPGSTTAQSVAAQPPGDMRFNLGTPATTGPGTTGGFLGAPPAQPGGEDIEHRSKFQYQPATNTDNQPQQPALAGQTPDTGAELPSMKDEPPL